MIKPHYSWEIIDSSKLSDFDRCPRYFFYSHILGWKLDTPQHDLYFGECWHMAREYQLIHGYDQIEPAYQTFLTHYRKLFPESTDHIYSPKCPAAVHQALHNFAVTYFNDSEDYELLRNPETQEPFTEISGTVPIDDNRVLYFRMDSMLRRKLDGKVLSWDHKTTRAYYLNSANWDKQFYLGIQNGTYTHCMYCLFPVEEVLGVEFCGVGFEYLSRGSSKRPQGYYSTLKRVPVFKTPDQMNVWLWNVIDKYNNVERELDRLTHCSDSDPVLQAFPLNPDGCTKYRGCEYHDFCMLWSNPLRQCQEPPFGFCQSYWDPREKDARNKMNLEWR